MPNFEIELRSPSGRAWIMFLAGIIIAGELWWEVRKDEPATLFKIPFTDGELIPWIVLLLVIAALGAVWLVALYRRPGRLVFDPNRRWVTRVRRPVARQQVVDAAASEWKIRMVYFSDSHRERGVFKRVELIAPGLAEVLLFSDLPQGERLAKAIEEHRAMFGECLIEVERSAERAN